MRAGTCLALLCCLFAPAARAEPASRYGVAPDGKTYPQATPKEALASVIKAAGARRFDYVAAQLADPAFIDQRVKTVYGGKFEEQAADTASRLDPPAVKLLGRFLAAGKWAVDKDGAVVKLDGVKDRSVSFVRKDGRWYMQNRAAPER
jgi:hypothetical protein